MRLFERVLYNILFTSFKGKHYTEVVVHPLKLVIFISFKKALTCLIGDDRIHFVAKTT